MVHKQSAHRRPMYKRVRREIGLGIFRGFGGRIGGRCCCGLANWMR